MTHKAGSVIGKGLSPRGRGNRHSRASPLYLLRSIPAWAGQPTSSYYALRQKTVYPRVGGATMGGRVLPVCQMGLSPRGRGNPYAPTANRYPNRSIPAWAGQPPNTLNRYRIAPVYPRVGGATYYSTHPVPESAGLSPRGRGNPEVIAATNDYLWSIPAWAGQPWPDCRVTSL